MHSKRNRAIDVFPVSHPASNLQRCRAEYGIAAAVRAAAVSEQQELPVPPVRRVLRVQQDRQEVRSAPQVQPGPQALQDLSAQEEQRVPRDLQAATV